MTALFILGVFVVCGAYIVWEVGQAEDADAQIRAVREQMRADIEARAEQAIYDREFAEIVAGWRAER